MIRRFRRWKLLTTLAILFALAILKLINNLSKSGSSAEAPSRPDFLQTKFRWKNVQPRHPVQHYRNLPTGLFSKIPKIQADFQPESDEEQLKRNRRLAGVKEAFLHSWNGYKKNAWLQDEVGPLTGVGKNGFGGWGATLVDTLDTLYIMGLKEEFAAAALAVKKIDFTHTHLLQLNVFETNIRYLGGLLSAYDLSAHKYKVLLEKAIEVGDMLYVAFDTPNRMPVVRWDWKKGAEGIPQEVPRVSLLAEVGSLSLEFTRLSQVTGDSKWYDAIARITDVFYEQQNTTKLPGLWPVRVDPANAKFNEDATFTIGDQADSFYEYLPKQHILLGGHTEQYREMYLTTIEAAKQHLFFRALNPSNKDILFAGATQRHYSLPSKVVPDVQHLACFAGGMVALGAKVFQKPQDLNVARQLVDGCIWAYDAMPSGIMPENFYAAVCPDSRCQWSEKHWLDAISTRTRLGFKPQPKMRLSEAQKVIQDSKLPRGITQIVDPRYLLRPEAIESMFVLYRTTGDKSLQDRAWTMFEAIANSTRTKFAFASVQDVMVKPSERDEDGLIDEMQSFWTAETLKYFYLIFSEPDVISLDDYVLNTEAHPLLRPK